MDGTYTAELWSGLKDLDTSDCIAMSGHPTREAAAEALAVLKSSASFDSDWKFACVEGPEGRSHVVLRRIKGYDCGYGFDAYAEAMSLASEEEEAAPAFTP